MAHRDSSSAPPAGGGLADRLEDQASDFAMVGITSASRDLDFEVPSPLSSGRTGAPRTAFSAFFGRSGSSKESGGEPGSPSKRGAWLLVQLHYLGGRSGGSEAALVQLAQRMLC